MYILVQEPVGNLEDAFSILDDAFGASEFSESEAVTVLTQAFESQGKKYWALLKQGAYVAEV